MMSSISCLFRKCSPEEFNNILQTVADGICRSNCSHYEKFKDKFSLEEWWNATDAIEELLTVAVKKKLNKSDLVKHIPQIDDEARTIIGSVLESRRNELESAFLEKSLSVSPAYLTDFDWRLKLALASDKFSRLREPLLNLDLNINKEGSKEIVSLELSRDELGKMISSLEAANKASNQLKI